MIRSLVSYFVAATCITAYIALCYFSPREYLPWLLIFAVATLVLVYFNPRRRYQRLGVSVIALLLSPSIISFFAYVNVPGVGVLQVQPVDPHWLFYVSGCLIAITCLALDFLANTDFKVPLSIGDFKFFSRSQFAIGSTVNQTHVETMHNYAAPASSHAEVTQAAEKLLEGQPAVAIELLKQISLRTPSSDKRLLFRIHANLAFAYLEQDEPSIAVTELHKALDAERDTAEAAGLEALAFFLVDRDANAHSSAKDALRRFPTCDRAAAVYIQTAPSDYQPSDFSDILEPPLNDQVEVLYALSRRALALKSFAQGVAFARRALAKHPESLRLVEHLASSIQNEQSDAFERHHTVGGPPPDQSAVKEALNLHLSVLSKTTNPSKALLVRIHHKLAICHLMLNDDSNADAHFSTALVHDPKSADVLRHYARFLLKSGKDSLAIKCLKDIPPEEAEVSDRLMLAKVLFRSAVTENETEAFSLLKSGLSELPNVDTEERDDWICLLCRTAIPTGNSNWFEQEYDRLKALTSKPWLFFAFATERALDATDAKSALEATRQWIQLLGPNDSASYRSWAASACRRAGDYHLAFEAWKPVAIASQEWPYWRDVLDCAVRAQSDDFVLSYCRQLRENGCYDPICLHTELDTLGRYHEELQAISLVDAYLPNISDTALRRILNVRRSVFALRIGRKDLLDTTETNLPPADTADEVDGTWTVEVLRQAGERERAVRYAYSLLRRFPQSTGVNQVYVAAFELGAEDIRSRSDTVVGDDAVKYIENDTGAVHWIVIEAQGLQLLADEIGPGHPLAKNLLGKRKGDTFTLRDDNIQPRTGTIQEIRSKYALRMMHILDSWETRFPENKFVVKFVAEKHPDGTPDVSSLVRSLAAIAADDDLAKQTFKNNPLGIAFFAKMMGVTHVQAAFRLGNDLEIVNRCTTGSPELLDEALALVRSGRVAVLDPSSVAMLFATGIYERLEALPTRCCLTHSTMATLQEEVDRVDTGPVPAGYTHVANGRLIYVPHDPAAHSHYVKRLQKFKAWLERHVEVHGGSSAAKLSREERERYEPLFGSAYLESVSLAKELGAVHWTDDFTVALVLDGELGVPRIWTQAYFMALAEPGTVSNEVREFLAVQLLRLGVEPTYWDASVAIAAAKAADWRSDQRPLRAIGDTFAIADARTSVVLAIQICLLVQKEPIITAAMDDFLTAIFRRISARPDGDRVLNTISRHLESAFGIDVTGAIRIHTLIARAKSTASRGGLILP